MTDTVSIRYERGQCVAQLLVAGEEIEGCGMDLPEAIRDLADNYERMRESL